MPKINCSDSLMCMEVVTMQLQLIADLAERPALGDYIYIYIYI